MSKEIIITWNFIKTPFKESLKALKHQLYW